ncbi:hypothetical protein FA95DRAFT_1608520 [Auriscalpium vulgare]|uniref:Uncharacterized protein n=1 Tax=Auriscalpium vulgare TaxID=40419 RepID=A0ACB8RL95_9AGAM|nr:hypothetical protein FA95DRAFT_1608520 [Auriscalpium vulgare]
MRPLLAAQAPANPNLSAIATRHSHFPFLNAQPRFPRKPRRWRVRSCHPDATRAQTGLANAPLHPLLNSSCRSPLGALPVDHLQVLLACCARILQQRIRPHPHRVLQDDKSAEAVDQSKAKLRRGSLAYSQCSLNSRAHFFASHWSVSQSSLPPLRLITTRAAAHQSTRVLSLGCTSLYVLRPALSAPAHVSLPPLVASCPIARRPRPRVPWLVRVARGVIRETIL